jgi:sigma-B regulation protein RsbU (phosphoserine phosphatase)
VDGPHILVIDDDDALRESLVAYLDDSGFAVSQAGNGREGIERFRSNSPDLILCDLRMPEMDGLQVLEQVKRESPEMPFIIVSGAGVLGDVIDALRLGAWDYITKPVQDMAMLEHAVRKSLERARLVRENRIYRDKLEIVNRELQDRMYRLEKDEEIGRDIQFQLLPERRKTFGHYEVSRRLYPSLYLSGDFIDYFAVDEHRLGCYVADVSGHGVSSAFVTVLLYSSVHHYLEEYRQGKNDDILHPAKLLARLNRSVVHSRVDKYLTIFYAVVDRRNGDLSYCNGALHPCPLLFDAATGEAVFLEAKDLPVGLYDFAEYGTHRLRLPAQCILMAFSDGILELLPEQTLAEKRAFLPSLLTDMEVSMESLTRRLGLTEQRMLPDDVSMLMLKKRG